MKKKKKKIDLNFFNHLIVQPHLANIETKLNTRNKEHKRKQRKLINLSNFIAK